MTLKIFKKSFFGYFGYVWFWLKFFNFFSGVDPETKEYLWVDPSNPPKYITLRQPWFQGVDPILHWGGGYSKPP